MQNRSIFPHLRSPHSLSHSRSSRYRSSRLLSSHLLSHRHHLRHCHFHRQIHRSKQSSTIFLQLDNKSQTKLALP